MSGPSLNTIFRDVIGAGTLPHEPNYPDMCFANMVTIYMVNILLMQHRRINTSDYMDRIKCTDPEGFVRVDSFDKWQLLNTYLREYIEETKAKKDRRLSRSV
jgi:hypothetical protein